MRATRGLRYCATRLIVLPLPAASRPSKTHDEALALGPHPLLHLDELGLQPEQLLLVQLLREAAFVSSDFLPLLAMAGTVQRPPNPFCP